MLKGDGDARRITKPSQTIGLKAGHRALLRRLTSGCGFEDDLCTARCVVSIALQAGLKGEEPLDLPCLWSIDALDPSGTFLSLVELMDPKDVDPVVRIERLLNAGFALLARAERALGEEAVEHLLREYSEWHAAATDGRRQHTQDGSSDNEPEA